MSSTTNALTCPTCKNRPLARGSYRGFSTELDVCNECRGMWFDHGEFDEIVSVAARELRADDDCTLTRYRCPRCQRVLRQMLYPQTETPILICVDCHGLWMTAEQFKSIRQQRYRLKREGKLQSHAPVTGAKGRWIRYVNKTIEELQKEYAAIRR